MGGGWGCLENIFPLACKWMSHREWIGEVLICKVLIGEAPPTPSDSGVLGVGSWGWGQMWHRRGRLLLLRCAPELQGRLRSLAVL